MKGFLHLFVRWARCAGTRECCPALAALVSPILYNIFFSHCPLFHIMFPHWPASWAASLAESPVSYYVSLVGTVEAGDQAYLMESMCVGASEQTLRVFGSNCRRVRVEHIGLGRIVQETYHPRETHRPRDATSKGRNIQEIMHHPRDATSMKRTISEFLHR
jgi:hypothetical protein